ncbi:MAG: molybdenum ABC transporter ATP-binding protein [Colwellia sp.]|nr:molybdenum ABC transporter ATP-binding protein [Colwellia sp.]
MTKLNLDFSLHYKAFNFTIKQALDLTGITGVFGHSGSGKSTLLRAIAGLEKNITGSIIFNKKTLIATAQNFSVKPEQRYISLVFQDSRLFPHLTVRDNLTYAAKRCVNGQLKLTDILKLTELEELADANVLEISSGQRQRVALARALLTEPKLLLLDEPLSALDQLSKTKLLRLIVKIQQQLNIPILYVSHSVDELQQVCDNILVLAQGKVVSYGNIHQTIHQLNFLCPRLPSEQLIHQQTSLSLPIASTDNGQGLMVLTLAEQEILLPRLPDMFIKKQQLRCFILASDISICLNEPQNSTIVNQLSGQIKAIESSALDESTHSVLITVICSAQEFFVHISSYSQQKLALAINQQVYLQFKAGAVRTYLY